MGGYTQPWCPHEEVMNTGIFLYTSLHTMYNPTHLVHCQHSSMPIEDLALICLQMPVNKSVIGWVPGSVPTC